MTYASLLLLKGQLANPFSEPGKTAPAPAEPLPFQLGSSVKEQSGDQFQSRTQLLGPSPDSGFNHAAGLILGGLVNALDPLAGPAE